MRVSIIRAMDTNEIIQEIEAELARLRMARALLGGETNSHEPGKPGRRKMSADARARNRGGAEGPLGEGERGEVS
jgi:hypothetical protein